MTYKHINYQLVAIICYCHEYKRQQIWNKHFRLILSKFNDAYLIILIKAYVNVQLTVTM